MRTILATISEPTTAAVSSPSSPLLDIRNVAKSFGKIPVLRDISLQVAEGEFLTILGESGSGKTTLLRIIAGFEAATSGEILMGGERLDNLPPYRRRVNTVFQHYALFPHLTVAENVGYGLRVAKLPQQEIATRVEQALDMVKMAAYAAAKPSKISGGQQQRIALARALVNRPRLLLLDEPLSALDANLRRQMQVELKSLQREVGIAFVFVTHDQEDRGQGTDRQTPDQRGDRGRGDQAAEFAGTVQQPEPHVHVRQVKCVVGVDHEQRERATPAQADAEDRERQRSDHRLLPEEPQALADIRADPQTVLLMPRPAERPPDRHQQQR